MGGGRREEPSCQGQRCRVQICTSKVPCRECACHAVRRDWAADYFCAGVDVVDADADALDLVVIGKASRHGN